ncbi:MAG TPA: Hsp20/alpha crystallin family protein [Tepidiformaceae bacterium]|nr:Hsp20/alpha crystallin family protein [Tepidiformaceae bacterium]
MPTSLTRWDPFAEFASMRTAMDRLFDQRFGRFPALRANEDLGPATLGLDVYETDGSYVVKAAVPGVSPDQLDISVEDDVLSIKGSFEQKDESQDETYLRRELRSGSFERTLRLPPTVDAERADAEFDRGMLKLTLPKREEAKARSIKITPRPVLESGDEPNQ